MPVNKYFFNYPRYLRGGSTRLKIPWVQQRQHHRAQESVRERVLRNTQIFFSMASNCEMY